MSDPIRILLADDHAVVRNGLAALLSFEEDLEVVGQASNGREALELFENTRPHVVLMDLRMPELGGADAIRKLRADHPQAAVLVLTTFDGDEDVYRALDAGAAGYLLKDCATEDLVAAVREVAGGGTHIPPHIAQRLVERTRSGPALSARERDVLALIAEGCANKEIGKRLFITEGTVKTHVNKILDKLGAPDRTGAVTIALQRGLIELPGK